MYLKYVETEHKRSIFQSQSIQGQAGGEGCLFLLVRKRICLGARLPCSCSGLVPQASLCSGGLNLALNLQLQRPVLLILLNAVVTQLRFCSDNV